MNYVTVTDFYSGSGTYDAAFVAAFAANPTVRVPSGNYTITNPIELFSGYALIGDSYTNTRIISNSAALPVVRIKSAAEKFQIVNLNLSHAGTSVAAGGNGIRQEPGSSCDQGFIFNVVSEYNWFGLNLEQTARSVLQNVDSRFNVMDGFRMNGSGTNPLQWQFEGCGAGRNGGDGFHWVTTGTANGTSTGTLSNCTTFNNGGRGVSADGTPTNPLQGIRILGGFFGEDLGSGINLNTYGSGHFLTPIYVENCGDCGIYIGGNNALTHVAPGVIIGNGRDGLLTAGRDTNIVGGLYIGNGPRQEEGRQSGIYVFEASANISGVRCLDNGANQQAFGVVANPNTLIVGCDLRGNGVIGRPSAAITGTPAPESIGNRL